MSETRPRWQQPFRIKDEEGSLASLGVLEEATLTLELTFVCQILCNLQSSHIGAGPIPDSKVPDVDEAAVKVDPELSHVLLPGAEVRQDSVNDIHTGRGMAVLHLAANHGFSARENPVGPFAEEAHAVVGIDEGQVHGQSLEESFQLSQ